MSTVIGTHSKWLGALATTLGCLFLAPPANGATDPLFIFTPQPSPPKSAEPFPLPTGRLNGPCGIAVDVAGRFYVSDYYHNVVDVFSPNVNVAEPWKTYENVQLTKVDPLDGPCGLAINSSFHLYVNTYHRNIIKYGSMPAFGPGAAFPLPSEDTAHHLPTGVAVDTSTNRVYVNYRTFVSVFDASGNPVEVAGAPLEVGKGSLGDGYGIAVSQFPGTAGHIYVPDAQTNTVKVYNPLIDKANPVATIKSPLGEPFVSLRDAAIAVDRVTGDVYVADNNQPQYTELPQATIHVYSAANTYKGHLKYNVIDGLPPGLAVDNSLGGTQGRVYVTSGNSDSASVYVYGPGSATFAAPLPPFGSGLQSPSSSSASRAASSSPAPTEPDDAATATAPPATTSQVVQQENVRVAVSGKLSPKRLPRKGMAPIAVSVGWDISTTDGSPPPKLTKLAVEINREGRFDHEGLPTCPYGRIQPATTQRALSNCRNALVGRGSFQAWIALKGQEGEAYEVTGRLLVFNGVRRGKPVLFGHIYSARPFSSSFVITFEVKEVLKGAYGTLLTAELPPALRGWGNLTGIEMNLSRRYSFKGKRRSYLSASCPAPKGFRLAYFKLARTAFVFADGRKISTTVEGDCRVRG